MWLEHPSLSINHLRSPKADSSLFNLEAQCLSSLCVAKGLSLVREKYLKCFYIVWLSIQKTGFRPLALPS